MNRRAFLLSAAAGALQAQARPNVVVFLTDDLGYGDIGPYGVTDTKTPSLDRLARSGVRFTDSYSNGPVCTPTRCALMTGRYQQRYGLEWALLPTQVEEGLPSEEPSLPRLLRNAGYRTGMFGKWHLGFRPEHGPSAHGFEEFFGILGGNADMYGHSNVNGTPDLWEGTSPAKREGYLTELLTERAVRFIDAHASEPFFLYVPYNSVHWPFQPPGRPDKRTRENWQDGNRADYIRMVESVDSSVGAVVAALERNKLIRNTLVIFTNDNGGERYSRNAPFFHHKATVWEGGLRVPTILSWPDRVPAGKTSAQPMITMDLTATVLAAAGVKPARDLDGIDLLPVITGKQPARERTFCWRIDRGDRKQKAIRRADFKYVRDGAIDLLFNLANDPGERTDIAPSHPEKLAELRRALADWEQDLARDRPRSVVK